jgi:hypothetical protein
VVDTQGLKLEGLDRIANRPDDDDWEGEDEDCLEMFIGKEDGKIREMPSSKQSLDSDFLSHIVATSQETRSDLWLSFS